MYVLTYMATDILPAAIEPPASTKLTRADSEIGYVRTYIHTHHHCDFDRSKNPAETTVHVQVQAAELVSMSSV